MNTGARPAMSRQARGWAMRRLLGAALWAATVWAQAAPAPYDIGPAPSWVQAIAPEETSAVPRDQVSRGVHYLLLDHQTRVDGAQRTQYRHVAVKALNEQGVTTMANVGIDFDPAYQALTLHAIKVRRAGRVIDKLANASIRVLQRERELDYQILDGTLSASAVLEDVRVGDVVEYAYTLRGWNPVFAGRHFGGFDLQWAAPVHRLSARLLWPAGRPIYVQPRNTTIQAQTSEHDGEREYRWEATDIPALVVQDGAPAWYDPYPAVQWGEFKDWAAVSRWAEPLYRAPSRLDPALQAEVDRIARAHTRAGDRLVAALRLVQAEVRYLGVEIGAGSHAPTAPGVVWQRRFGDCKDKTLLTVTLLRALGIEAQPALVNTRHEHEIAHWQPTPAAFNHVIVRAQVDGADYWLDPTLSPQKSTLEHLAQAHFGQALVISPATQGLVAMPLAPSSVLRRDIHTVFDVTGGTTRPVPYTVTTVFEGASAESMRSTLASRNRDQLQKDYVNFYAGYFEGVKLAAPFEVADDEAQNRLTITEHYLLPNFWRASEKEKGQEADVQVPDMHELLLAPHERVRSAPLGIQHAVDVTHVTEVRMSTGWNVEAGRSSVAGSAFEIERSVEAQGNTLVLSDHYVSRADHVPPSSAARYLADLQRAREIISYSITTPNARPEPVTRASVPGATTGPARDDPAPTASTASARLNWPVVMIAALLLGIYVAQALKVYRYDPPPRPDAGPEAYAWPIGGWLLLLALGVGAMPLRLLYQLFKLAPGYSLDTWSALATGASASLVPLLLFELAVNLAMLVFAVALAVMFFQRRRGAPTLYIAISAFAVLVQAIDLAWVAALPSGAVPDSTDWATLVRSILGLLAWGVYLRRSKRVRATFIRSRQVRPPTPAVVAEG